MPCGFYLLLLLSSIFFPRLISAAADWMSTIYFHTWCGPGANLECRPEMCCTQLAGNTGRKKSPFWHHRTTLSSYIFRTKACIDNRIGCCLSAAGLQQVSRPTYLIRTNVCLCIAGRRTRVGWTRRSAGPLAGRALAGGAAIFRSLPQSPCAMQIFSSPRVFGSVGVTIGISPRHLL